MTTHNYIGQSAPASCQAPAAIRGSGCSIYESSYIEFWNSEIELMSTKKNYVVYGLWASINYVEKLRQKSLSPLASVCYKTTLNTGGVGGAGADTQT